MSGAFKFSLDRVLHWRALELAIEEARLKRLLDEKIELESQLETIDKNIASAAQRLVTLEDLRGLDLNGEAAYTLFLSKERARVLRLLEDKERLAAEQAGVHRKAKQRHRLLEELRARKYRDWRIETAREWDYLAHESFLARWKQL